MRARTYDTLRLCSKQEAGKAINRKGDGVLVAFMKAGQAVHARKYFKRQQKERAE